LVLVYLEGLINSTSCIELVNNVLEEEN